MSSDPTMNNHSHTMAAPQMSVKDLMGDFRLASWETVLLVTGVVLAYKAAAAACGAAYNVFFHPLRRFPGPTTWIAMPWVRNLYHIRGQADRAVVRLHERLGPVVRVAPDTLSFISAAAWKDIYGTGHAELPKHIYKGTGMEERPNIITAHPRDHHRFRKAMQPAFTNDAISREEPLIMSYVDMLIDNLRRIARSPEGEKEGSYSTVNMAKWYTMTTFDIFGDLCYGESFKGLETQSEHPWIQSMGVLKMLVPLLVFPYVSALLPYLLLSAKQRGSLTDHQSRSYGLTMKRIANKDVHPKHDFMTFMLRDRSKDDGLTDHELASNSDIIISAGSETTSTALTGVTYFLARNPDALARCQAEVRGRFDREEDITFQGTSQLPYLLACIDEALRLYPPVPTALIRRTLPGRPMLIDGHLLPEHTVVGVHHLAMYTSEANFHDAKSYRPERWLPESVDDPASPFHGDDRGCLRPFSYGPRNCIGRNLAYHEMRLILSRVIYNFDLALDPSCEDWYAAQRTYQLWEKPPLKVRLKERTRKAHAAAATAEA